MSLSSNDDFMTLPTDYKMTGRTPHGRAFRDGASVSEISDFQVKGCNYRDDKFTCNDVVYSLEEGPPGNCADVVVRSCESMDRDDTRISCKTATNSTCLFSIAH